MHQGVLWNLHKLRFAFESDMHVPFINLSFARNALQIEST